MTHSAGPRRSDTRTARHEDSPILPCQKPCQWSTVQPTLPLVLGCDVGLRVMDWRGELGKTPPVASESVKLGGESSEPGFQCPEHPGRRVPWVSYLLDQT